MENRHELMLQTKIENHKAYNISRGFGHYNDKFNLTDEDEDEAMEKKKVVIESEEDKRLKIIRKMILREQHEFKTKLRNRKNFNPADLKERIHVLNCKYLEINLEEEDKFVDVTSEEQKI